MIKILLLILFFIIYAAFPLIRCAINNFPLTGCFGLVDLFYYFRYKMWNNATCGELIAFCGLFGKGKTLSAVHLIVQRYKRYDGKRVYDKHRKKFVTQHILILSNVDLVGVPYIPFTSLQLLVDLSKKVKLIDEENDTLTYIYCLGDEFSVQLNSRNFAKNFDALFLNTLLTCRHYHISIFYTTQRFNQVDALLRQVTQNVIECNKVWRFQLQTCYDGYELENCVNPTLVQPLNKSCWFIRNKDFACYDTLACVSNLEKSIVDGDMISKGEIIAMQNAIPSDTVVRYSRKAKKRKRFK